MSKSCPLRPPHALNRRQAMAGLGAAGAMLLPTVARAAPDRFSFETVIASARELARRPFVPRSPIGSQELAKLGYDGYFDIRSRPEIGLWPSEGSAFRAEPLHTGFRNLVPVDLFLARDGSAERVSYSPRYFDYSDSDFRPSPGEDYGFSGFRLAADGALHELEGEFIVFHGASYFRAIGKGMAYGLSARGLAVAAGRDETFPVFRTFWIEVPDPWARESVSVWALLDGISVAGAYRFIITPGSATFVDVEAVLFPRADIADAGIAPLTSMFLFGPSQGGRFRDFRSTVHDSDALLIWESSGRRTLRPLRNPMANSITHFDVQNPVGFGLLQSEREFALYQDLEAKYHLRPSCWVAPKGKWGRGRVTLVELHTGAEWSDNIVACWEPEGGLRAAGEYRFAYELKWFSDVLPGGDLLRVAMTRIGERSGRPHFVVEFAGAIDAEQIRPRASASGGHIRSAIGQRNPAAGRYRVSLDFEPREATQSRLELTLDMAGKPVSERWVFDWSR